MNRESDCRADVPGRPQRLEDAAATARILFVHAGGRRARLARFERGDAVPKEFFYGLTELRAAGLAVDLMETTELSPAPAGWRYKFAAYKDRRRSAKLGLVQCERLFLEELRAMNRYRLVIAGTEYVALGLADHLRAGKLHPPMLFFVMGMLSKALKLSTSASRVRRLVLSRYRELLAASSAAVFLGEGEFALAAGLFPSEREKMHFVPFGVDAAFWSPGPVTPTVRELQPFFLFVGNDANRDVGVLRAIAEAMPEQRFVVLSSLIEAGKETANMTLVRSNWKTEVLSDEEVRAYYRAARAVVLPINDTTQPSGQSVALQAMACGCPVVISDFPGFWERGALIDERDLFLANPNTAERFVGILSQLRACGELAQRAGANGRARVLERYRSEHFGGRILDVVRRLMH